MDLLRCLDLPRRFDFFAVQSKVPSDPRVSRLFPILAHFRLAAIAVWILMWHVIAPISPLGSGRKGKLALTTAPHMR